MKVTKIILGSLSSMLLVAALFFTVQNVSYLNSLSEYRGNSGFYQLNSLFIVKTVSADPGLCEGPPCSKGTPYDMEWNGTSIECCYQPYWDNGKKAQA